MPRNPERIVPGDSALPVRIDPGAISALLGHAARARPLEACGALLGSVSPPAIADAVAVENEAADPTRRYAIPARRVREVARSAASRGLDVVGFFHSHPVGIAEPSPADLEAALPGYLYVIVGRERGGDSVRAWKLAEDRDRFEEASLLPGMSL